jgi:hypothetical protein
VCFDFLCKLCFKYLLFREELREIRSKKYIGLNAKYHLFLCDFNDTLSLSTDIRINIQISNFMKIRPARAKLFQAYG